MYYVIKPTQEDAGRSALLKSCRSEQEAIDFINSEVVKSNGYYQFNSFILARAQREFE